MHGRLTAKTPAGDRCENQSAYGLELHNVTDQGRRRKIVALNFHGSNFSMVTSFPGIDSFVGPIFLTSP